VKGENPLERTKPFKVAVLGTGNSAHDHVNGFLKAGVEVVAVHGSNPERRDSFAKQYGIPIQVSDYRELLHMAEIDAVAICLPNYLHAPIAIDAMRAGKHVLTEKPMALDGASAAEMVRVQKETNKTLMVSLQVRYSPAVRLAKQFAAEFGEIYYGKCAYTRRSGIPGWGSWFTRKEQAGGGPTVDVAIHVLDQCLYLMGYPRPLYVSAHTYAKFGVRGQGKGPWGTPDPTGYCDVEDLASALITLENGGVIALETSWAYHGPDKRSVEVFGTEGGLSLDMMTSLTVYKNQFDTPVTLNPTLPEEDERDNMAKHFVECCTTGKTPDTSPEHGLILNKIFDAIYKSGDANGKQVKVDL
jgi:predicted dehydrogenase